METKRAREAFTQTSLALMKENGHWNGSFNGRESPLHQLAPYIGKLKSGMAHALLETFTKPKQWVCDPFAGSGVVPLEALLMKRRAVANDLSVYAYTMTLGKLTAEAELDSALKRSSKLIAYVGKHAHKHDLHDVDYWVRAFFHPETLKETLAAFDYAKKRKDYFLSACLCGILHHQRPGFLSYPSSHLVPYLRTKLFPPEQFSELYEYRSLPNRIEAKVKRVYRRHY